MTNRYQGTDPILTDVSLGYQNSAYIAGLLLPMLPVKHQSGKHFVYDKGRFRSEDAKRGPGARSKDVTHNISTGLTYFCEDHALKEFVADEDVDNAPPGIDPCVDATENVTESPVRLDRAYSREHSPRKESCPPPVYRTTEIGFTLSPSVRVCSNCQSQRVS